MESQVHYLEKEAYFAVLRAFKAQADAITWDKEGLITELRKELRVSDDEHREVLGRVNSDDLIRSIREWRQGSGQQGPVVSSSQTMHDVVSTPTFSASRKKQRTSQPLHSVGIQPSSAVVPPAGSYASRGRRPKPPQLSVPDRRDQYHGSSVPSAHARAPTRGPGKELIGRTVFTRWPDDNTFYEAVISNYDPNQEKHALVYDMGTPHEAWEWVDLKQMPPEDIRWVGEDPGISNLYNQSGPKSARHHARGVEQSREFENGTEIVAPDDIKILHTDTLIKEVQKVVDAVRPDILEIQRAKKMLKDHELSLVEAISRLTYASEEDTDDDGEIQI